MLKTILALSVLVSTSAFAKTISCVFTTENYVKITGAEHDISDLKADGQARIVDVKFYDETWIVSALKVGIEGDVIVTASKLLKTKGVASSIQINNEQPALNVSLKMDGNLSVGKTVASTLADTSHHLFCESN